MTDKSLEVIVGEAQSPVQDLTDYVIWERSRFMGQAYNGQSAISEIVFRDELSEFGPWTDTDITIAARNEVELKLGTTFIWRGRLIGRSWSRGVQKANEAREVIAEAEDVNVELRGIVVDQWVRPIETDVARVTALGADYLDGSVRIGADLDVTTYVPNTNTVILPAKTYTQSHPMGVLQDIIDQSHKMFFVTLDKELFYDVWDSTAYDSGLRITENPAELAADPTGTLAIIPDAGQLFGINGQQFLSAVRVVYGSGPTDYVDADDPALEAVKSHWSEVVYAPETVTNAQEATNFADSVLGNRSQDGRTFTLSVRNADGGSLTEAQVALIQPGRLITIKSHVLPLASYADYTTRIVSVQWHMPLAGVFYATLKLEKPEKAYGYGTKPGPRAAGCITGLCQETFTRTVVGSMNPSEIEQISYSGGAFDVSSDRLLMETTAALNYIVDGGLTNAGMPWDMRIRLRLSAPVPDVPPTNLILFAVVFNNTGVYTDGVFAGLLYDFDSGYISIRLNGFDTVAVIDPYTPTNLLHFRVRFDSTEVKAKAWLDTDPEPATWTGPQAGLGTGLTHMLWFAQGFGSATMLAEVEDFVVTEGLTCQTCDPVTTVGGTGEGEYADSGAYVPAGSVLEHADIVSGGPYHQAAASTIVDAGSYYTSTDVEGALQEIGAGGIGGGGGGGIAGELVTDTIIGDGATDTFALSVAPTGSWAMVSTNGSDLLLTEFSISGSDIVFDTPPANLSESLVTFITGGILDSGFVSIAKWGAD